MVRTTDDLQISGLRNGPGGLKWLGEPVHVWRGTADKIEAHIPEFDRRPFTMDLRGGVRQGQTSFVSYMDGNRYLDVIVRLPNEDYVWEVPVGIVSKRYTLVPHRELFYSVLDALRSVGVGKEELRIQLLLTEYGSRMALRFYLPRRFAFDPGDGRFLSLRVECFNSVERSIPLRLMLGWFRAVCANGLVMGATEIRVEQIHNEFLDLSDIERVLAAGLARVAAEKGICQGWFNCPVGRERLAWWVDGPLRERWGVLAASRAFYIATTGWDGVPEDRFEKSLPHKKRMKPTRRVPGAGDGADNAYAISQVLAWLAKERRDLQEQVEWSESIPGLIDKLIANPRAGQAP